MRVTNQINPFDFPQQLGKIQERNSFQLASAREQSANVKSLDQSFTKVAEGLEKLAKMDSAIKDPTSYQATLKQLATDINQTSSRAKGVGGMIGRQILWNLQRIEEQLTSGNTGLKAGTDGTMQVDEAAAKSAFTSTLAQGKSNFQGASERASQIQPSIHFTLSAKANRLDGEVNKRTQSQLFISETTTRLSKTYDWQGETNTLSGPALLSQLM